MRTAITKEEFNRKISLLTSKLNLELRMKLMCSYTWSIDLYGSETSTLRTLERKYLESFELCKENIKWYEKVTNEEFLNI